MNRLPLLAGVLVLLAGCGSPERPLNLGFKEVPSDVVLGDQRSPTPAPSPTGAGPVALPPSIVTLPPPPFELPPPGPEPSPAPPLPTAPACPQPDLLAAPKLEAAPTVGKPPVQAAYLFDNTGTYSVSGADSRKGEFPRTTLRIFNRIQRFSAGSFSYDVSERIGDTTTTTTYSVSTDASLPGQSNGIFLTKMTWLRADGTTEAFTPVPGLQLAAFPLVRGATSDQNAVDPQTQTAMSFTSTVEGKARVFACGEPLDTWTLHLTKGRVISPTQDLEFDSTYQLATQFGGIVVSDAVAFRGQDGDATVQRSNRATIAQVPRSP